MSKEIEKKWLWNPNEPLEYYIEEAPCVDIKDYYFNDLSFSEMAENYDVSRNAIFKQIHIVTDKLEEYESILKLHEKRKKLEN